MVRTITIHGVVPKVRTSDTNVVHMYVHVYTCTMVLEYHGTLVYTLVPWYTRVHVYVPFNGTRVPWYVRTYCTRVRTHVRTILGTMPPWYHLLHMALEYVHVHCVQFVRTYVVLGAHVCPFPIRKLQHYSTYLRTYTHIRASYTCTCHGTRTCPWYEYHGIPKKVPLVSSLITLTRPHPLHPNGARAGPHACEDCSGDPRCRPRCRVGTVVYRDAFDADNAHEFPRCT
jgi:hypothetical protein